MVLTQTIPASQAGELLHSTYASRYLRAGVTKFKMPRESMPKEAAYEIINEELKLDGTPTLNLASFLTTWMEPECEKLMMASMNKNYVEMPEYPVTTEFQNRCVNMIADLFNANIEKTETAVGVGTVGSSEAVMLVGLASKRKWKHKRKSEGKPYDKPNIVAKTETAEGVGTETAVGVGTVGSSEAVMLAGLAFKRKWKNKREKGQAI